MSLGIHNYQRYIFGSPMLPSHPSTWEINTLVEGNPSFWQRLQNFIDVWSYLYYWTHNNAITEQKRAEEYFGSDTPNVVDIVKNMSILLVNENPALTYARPEQPNVIFFTGFHIQKTPPLLPEDLRQFLDDATEGFIYVSLGTTVSCDNLPTEIVGNFIQVFSKLPYKIVWKYECDELPGKLDNAFISKWFPQQGVLAHHNIRLFIYQGGLQSTEEAIHYAVPLLGIPIMFEQASRIQRLASLGAAIFLKLNELSKERLNTAIHQILNDKSYKERMAYLSELSKDQPYDSLENAIWWVEYVMRHKGISHLRFSESDKPWYQRYDMDIIGFLASPYLKSGSFRKRKMRAVVCVLYVILFSLSLSVNTGRILSLSVVPFLSHQLIYRTLNLVLHKRGHELVIVTTAPLKDPTLKNYTKIDVSYGFSIITEYNDAKWKISQMESCRQVFTITTEFMGTIWDNLEFKKIYRRNSGEKFDAIMMEPICDLSLYSMAHRFNAPLIGLTPMGFHNFQRYIFASPMLPSHPSNWEVNTLVEGYPSFWQKLQTFIDVWGYLYAWSHHVVTARKRVEKYFGSDTPDPMDIAKNMSIVLVNENPLFAYVRPEQPNVIYFSGFQIQKTPPTLPKVCNCSNDYYLADLRRFLDDATEGFIYVSLGTTVSCHNLPTEIIGNFIEVFSKLPFKIVWKYECDEFPGKLDNIFISKWFPHQGILAHHNIRLFIYQGGVHSTEEAIHYAVPLLGIPIMFEQASRIQRLASLGAAIFLKLNELSKERLNTAIHQILNDKSYKERMAYLSELSKDQPYDSLENAIWWVEYVMRHKGISHLRFSESDKPWYQRYDMDIIGFLAVMTFVAFLISFYTIFRILRFIYHYYQIPCHNFQYSNAKSKIQ
ncbi:hypothetical protein DMN91_000546 [Ooceraea biroi]|uniref:Ecdysteroid UDP-glucosyltransferase n=1 Tax=Ooceraea biroi TaxID=2015173 RepID=A0A3L8E3G1_OOCBI|nr:hypothetical protein DMN91_000546 [Ooceraea biroi]